ncbi:YceI family protein [Aequorivita marina]|uniref:YceI family protein n=1 Tax=Aequorivita marina TaxID=3073654 RepID=UPI002876049F|nr:YceI family protein [Aequorivita sp. S2608]MDS1299210.1 YceI family protein [Aequorivita sp. S2608]
MNPLLLFCFTTMLCLNAWSQPDFETKKVQILASSELIINGDTNISKFGCGFNTIYLEEYRDVAYQRNGNDISFTNAVLFLKNKGFDCGNKGINQDFHEMLNTKAHPNIVLELTKITLNKDESAIAKVLITISGVKKEYSLPVAIFSSPINRFVGSLKLNINDFNLEPPSKMFGLIKIKKDIDINFDLIAEL